MNSLVPQSIARLDGLNDTNKLTYLQDTLKDGPAKVVVEGLTRMSESYKEALRCLKEWYNRRRLVQAEHMCSIVDGAPVKNSSDKEIRCLYDAATQHY